ncbi:hypothetical protein [Microbacterium arborescens]|uniref:hypothetical protein n=1 Tax=Microbacterium arborescens TaxID=33883 RepID=UPI0025A14B32|nr:hypothetical protein [Microbacterium arborescens]WJM15307.1 hypothetical protein QUC20_13665 [Microbacterium arborescens]
MRNYRVTHIYDAADGWRQVRPFVLTADIRDELIRDGCTMVRVRSGLGHRKLSLIRVRDLH